MNHKLLLSLMVLGQCLLLGCQAVAPVTVHVAEVVEATQLVTPDADQPSTIEQQTPSCAHPNDELKPQCEAMAQQVLSTTVRVHVHHWQVNEDGSKGEYVDGGVGHGTVKDGRYLVTHNHYKVPLANVDDAELVQLTVKDWRGEMVLQDMPLTAVTVVAVDAETLVLDFGQYGEIGLLEMMGLPSAQYQSYESLSLQVGAEVAQVDWDGNKAHVDWTIVEAVHVENGVPQLRLANGLTEGASGGGVFWNGIHVANNWSCVNNYNQQTGELVHQYSVAAVNAGQSLMQLSEPLVNAS